MGKIDSEILQIVRALFELGCAGGKVNVSRSEITVLEA